MAALDGMEVGEDGDGWPNSNGLGVWALPDEMSTGDEVIEKLQEDRKSKEKSQKKNFVNKEEKEFCLIVVSIPFKLIGGVFGSWDRIRPLFLDKGFGGQRRPKNPVIIPASWVCSSRHDQKGSVFSSGECFVPLLGLVLFLIEGNIR